MTSIKYDEGKTYEIYPNIKSNKVWFTNRYGISVGADIFYPKEFDINKKYPAIIVGHPHGGVKEQTSGLYAQEMATKGYVTLAFDNSYNGDSGGGARKISTPETFVEDTMAAVDYIGTRKFIDRERIGALGICASGGFMLNAASLDPRIKAIATVSMYDMGTFYREWLGQSTEKRIDLLKESALVRWNDYENGTATINSESAFPLEMSEEEFNNTDEVWQEFLNYYGTDRARHVQSTGGFTLNSTPSLMNFRPFDNIDLLVGRPLLIISGDISHSRVFSEDAYNKAPDGNKELFIVENAIHTDLYDDKSKIPFNKLEEFFKVL